MSAAAALVLERPTSVDGVVDLLAERGVDARVMAGGQSLTPLLTLGLASPDLIVSLDRCGGLDTVAPNDDGAGFSIGARVTARTIELSPAVRRTTPLLADAAGRIGSVHVRNFGTAVGNVCHADPGGDLIPVLLCHDTVVDLRSRGGSRSVALDDFVVGPFQTVVEPAEVAVSCFVARPPGEWAHAYRKFVHRSGDLAVATCAAMVRLTGGRIAEARVSVGGAVSRAVRLHRFEAALVGVGAADLGDLLAADPLGPAAALALPDTFHGLDYLLTMFPRLVVATVSDAVRPGPGR